MRRGYSIDPLGVHPRDYDMPPHRVSGADHETAPDGQEGAAGTLERLMDLPPVEGDRVPAGQRAVLANLGPARIRTSRERFRVRDFPDAFKHVLVGDGTTRHIG